MENKKHEMDERFKQGQKGTGSAEHTGRSREDQMNKNTELEDEQRANVANEIGESKKDVTDPKDLGAMSGRDDYAGGFGANMSDEHTGESTDKNYNW